MEDELSQKEMGVAEQQWAALNNDDILLRGLRNGLAEKGITPVEVPEEAQVVPTAPVAPLRRQASTVTARQSEDPSSYEKAILALLDVRDVLIENFRRFAVNKDLITALVQCIRKTEDSVRDLGGSTDSFNPLASLSGLENQTDDTEQAMLANALKVAENTKTHYKLYAIPKMQVRVIKERPAVLVQIAGTDNGKKFLVNCQVVANTDFSGNEAIDYVREGDKQMFMVKAVRLGKWEDISDNFIIKYKDMSGEIA